MELASHLGTAAPGHHLHDTISQSEPWPSAQEATLQMAAGSRITPLQELVGDDKVVGSLLLAHLFSAVPLLFILAHFDHLIMLLLTWWCSDRLSLGSQ